MSESPATKEDTREVLSVYELTQRADRYLSRVGHKWVAGEVSELKRSGPGHLYLTLNDPKRSARLAVTIFASDAELIRFNVELGMVIEVRGNLGVYAPYGRFNMIGKTVLRAGEGDRKEKVARLKAKLTKEGLFDLDRKRSLPRFPRRIGVVTSVRGAALQDVRRVIAGRLPTPLLVADCRVQGAGAVGEILGALRAIEQVEDVDLILVVRGGGAKDDLSAFDEEPIVRQIARARVPVITGIGHQTDRCLADLAADHASATPSNAAEQAVPEKRALELQLTAELERLAAAMKNRVRTRRHELTRARSGLADPRTAMSPKRGQLGVLGARLERAWTDRHSAQRRQLRELDQRVRRADVRAVLERQRRDLVLASRRLEDLSEVVARPHRDQLRVLDDALSRLSERALQTRQGQLGSLMARCDALSPLRVLARGYAVVTHEREAVTHAEALSVGDTIEVRLMSGTLEAEVTKSQMTKPEITKSESTRTSKEVTP